MAAAVAAGETLGSERRSMGDGEILRNLREVHGWRNVDQGAGGNCLFLSIAPQVTAADLEFLLASSPRCTEVLGSDVARSWEGLLPRQRAEQLRRIAMLNERDFFALLRSYVTQGEPVPPEAHWRAQELFKDMAEEFISQGKTELAEGMPRGWVGPSMQEVYQRVRDVTRDTPPAGVYDFVLRHAEEYMQITGREGNWAGSSEMAALAHAFGRSFAAYGNNWVSQDKVELRAGGSGVLEVMPYFAVAAPDNGRGLPPVRIFQTGGGGHYQMLLAD